MTYTHYTYGYNRHQEENARNYANERDRIRTSNSRYQTTTQTYRPNRFNKTERMTRQYLFKMMYKYGTFKKAYYDYSTQALQGMVKRRMRMNNMNKGAQTIQRYARGRNARRKPRATAPWDRPDWNNQRYTYKQLYNPNFRSRPQ